MKTNIENSKYKDEERFILLVKSFEKDFMSYPLAPNFVGFNKKQLKNIEKYYEYMLKDSYPFVIMGRKLV